MSTLRPQMKKRATSRKAESKSKQRPPIAVKLTKEQERDLEMHRDTIALLYLDSVRLKRKRKLTKRERAFLKKFDAMRKRSSDS